MFNSEAKAILQMVELLALDTLVEMQIICTMFVFCSKALSATNEATEFMGKAM